MEKKILKELRTYYYFLDKYELHVERSHPSVQNINHYVSYQPIYNGISGNQLWYTGLYQWEIKSCKYWISHWCRSWWYGRYILRYTTLHSVGHTSPSISNEFTFSLIFFHYFLLFGLICVVVFVASVLPVIFHDFFLIPYLHIIYIYINIMCRCVVRS